MFKPIVITTLCDKIEIAEKIQDTLLNKKLVAGCQISERKSKYWWNGELEIASEYHLEIRTKESLFEEIKRVIRDIHDYEVCEISYYEIKGANKDFLDWIKKETILQGTAYEDVEECSCDIIGAIKFAVELGYTKIHLEGHSLGSTKIVYTYNQMLKENSKYLKHIKSIILLSLIDIPDMLNTYTAKEFIKLANDKENENKTEELMPIDASIHLFSVKTFLRYIKYNNNIDFAQYNNENYNFEYLNNIKIPLFMRWGNDKELIKQDAKNMVSTLKNKIHNEYLDINYINGADHSYKGTENILADEIYEFIKEVN